MTENRKETLEALRGVVAEAVKQIVAEKKGTPRRKKRQKPGGGLTDLGAEKRVRKATYAKRMRGAIASSEGDVDSAAQELGIAPRTMYLHMQQEPLYKRMMDKVSDTATDEIAAEKKKEKEEETKREERNKK